MALAYERERESGEEGTYPGEDECAPPDEHGARARRVGVEERPEDGRPYEHGDPDDRERQPHSQPVSVCVSRVGVCGAMRTERTRMV